MSGECPICYEAITVATGHTTMSCSHTFHFKCLSSWFAQQDGASTCPCCRHEAAPIEDLPAAEEDEAEEGSDDDDDDASEGDAIIFMLKFELDETLKSLGGMGVTEPMWRHIFPGTEEEFTLDCCMSFSRREIEDYAAVQGGRAFTEAEWEELTGRFGVDEVPQPAVAAAAEPQEPPPPPHVAIEMGPALEAAALEPLRLLIRWKRDASGEWHREVLNPEEHSPASWGPLHAEPPPNELVVQTTEAAKKLQAVWRGHVTRTRLRGGGGSASASA